jgi:hypothetical protein
MTVRDHIAQSRGETRTRSLEKSRHSCYVHRDRQGSARQTELAQTAAFDHLAADRSPAFAFAAKACRSRESAIIVGAFMNTAG